MSGFVSLVLSPSRYLMITGFVLATIIYQLRPALADQLQQKLPRLHRLLENKFYIDELYQKLFVSKTINIGNLLWKKAGISVLVQRFLICYAVTDAHNYHPQHLC